MGILGTDITDMDTGHTDMDIMGTDTLATMERDLLMLSQLPMLLPTLRLILGTDTRDMDTGLTGVDTMVTDMDTTATAHTVITGVKLKPTTTCCFSLPTLL